MELGFLASGPLINRYRSNLGPAACNRIMRLFSNEYRRSQEIRPLTCLLGDDSILRCCCRRPSPQDVYAKASPSVVSVVSINSRGRPTSSGSGVVIAPGTVATNWHVVEGASTLTVRWKETNYSAELTLDRRDRDLAILRVSGLNAPVIKFGAADKVKIGQSVYAIGAPSGLELSLTNGLVSGLRAVEGGKLVQTSAPISPGSSGGGLFDEESKLIGITTLKLAGDGQEGLGFALPVDWVSELNTGVSHTGGGRSGIFLIAGGIILLLLVLSPKLVRLVTEKLSNSEWRSREGDAGDGHSEDSALASPSVDDRTDVPLQRFGLQARREFETLRG